MAEKDGRMGGRGGSEVVRFVDLGVNVGVVGEFIGCGVGAVYPLVDLKSKFSGNIKIHRETLIKSVLLIASVSCISHISAIEDI